jgi:DNA-binding Lrp family transcriptional regulator
VPGTQDAVAGWAAIAEGSAWPPNAHGLERVDRPGDGRLTVRVAYGRAPIGELGMRRASPPERGGVVDAGGQRGMVSAYVLVETEVGKAAGAAARAIKAIDGVEWADDLAGPYDVIARVQAPGLDELGRLVVARIQVVAGVTRTLTCMVM